MKRIIVVVLSVMYCINSNAQDIKNTETEKERIARLTKHQEDEKRRQAKYEEIAKIRAAEEKNEKIKKEQELKKAKFTQESLAYWSQLATLPFSNSKDGLKNWLSSPHPEFNLASWCFYGNVETDDGKIVAISSMIQQQLNMDGMPYLAEFSYCDDAGYKIVPFEVVENDVQFKQPFSVRVTYQYIPDVFLDISLLSGQFGQAGAKYKLSGNVIDLKMNNLKYEMIITDSYGVIQVGYGTTSFLPQWLTPSQYQTIIKDYNGSVPNYLNAREDSMQGQGSYYYSMPLLKVESFTMFKKTKLYIDSVQSNAWVPYAKATKGNIWMDYVVQGFNDQQKDLLKDANWQFLAIQFPESNASLMVSIVDISTCLSTNFSSKLPMARLYYGNQQSVNGSNQAYYEWNINEIDFKPSKFWTDSTTCIKYPIEFDLSLKSSDGFAINLKGIAVRNNQVIEDNVNKYEGVYTINGSIDVKDFHLQNAKGFAWGEIH